MFHNDIFLPSASVAKRQQLNQICDMRVWHRSKDPDARYLSFRNIEDQIIDIRCLLVSCDACTPRHTLLSHICFNSTVMTNVASSPCSRGQRANYHVMSKPYPYSLPRIHSIPSKLKKKVILARHQICEDLRESVTEDFFSL